MVSLKYKAYILLDLSTNYYFQILGAINFERFFNSRRGEFSSEYQPAIEEGGQRQGEADQLQSPSLPLEVTENSDIE